MVFPISYWCGPPVAEMTPERYREIVECGFTVAASPDGSSVAVNLKHLDLCQQAGIKGLIRDQRLVRERDAEALDQRLGWEEDVIRAVQDYSEHPALYGYYIGDEPHRKGFDDQARICHKLHELDPNHIAYINLYPNYAVY